MYGARDENVTKLHTDSAGYIWFCRGAEAVENSTRKLDEFLRQPIASGFGNIFRLLGVARNAELIAALFTRRKHNEVRAVEVAGPNALAGPGEIDNPALTILRLRSLIAAPAAGGWHEVTMSDYPTYALIARMHRNSFSFDETVANYLRLHPAYYALCFIPTLNPAATAQLLMHIVDPRWFVCVSQTRQRDKLGLFLGLTPAIQQEVSAATGLLTRRRALRCAQVLNSWKTVAPSEVAVEKPENFLYRIWQQAGGGWRGDLRASQAFVAYLRDNWLASLDKRIGTTDGLFAPDHYFKTPAERLAFKQYMALKRPL